MSVDELFKKLTAPPVKYPFKCGCAGPKYVSKCRLHQLEDIEAHARALGVGLQPALLTYFDRLDELRRVYHPAAYTGEHPLIVANVQNALDEAEKVLRTFIKDPS
jgi:hypothetical protein